MEAAEEYVQQRDVKWINHLPRTAFSQGALYEIGSAMSLFVIRNYTDEYLAALDKNFSNRMLISDEEDDSIAATAEDIVDSTRDFILKELGKNLKGYELEEFVADLLCAMGYRTTIAIGFKVNSERAVQFRSRKSRPYEGAYGTNHMGGCTGSVRNVALLWFALYSA